MDQNILRPDLLPPTVPTPALWALAVLLPAAWVAVHLFVRKKQFPLRIRLALLLPTATVGCWCIFQVLGRYLYLAGHWHLLFTAFLSAVSIESVAQLYHRELKLIQKRWMRNCVLLFRVLAVSVVLFMLLQPVMVGEKKREFERRVVVLLDDSASMNFVDTYWTEAERFDVARALGLLRANDALREADAFAEFPQEIDAQLDTFKEQIRRMEEARTSFHAEDFCKALKPMISYWEAVPQNLESLRKKVNAAKEPQLASNLPRYRAHIEQSLLRDLREVLDSAEKNPQKLENILRACNRAVQNLTYLRSVSESLKDASTAAAFQALPKQEQEDILRASDTTRADIARRLLTEELVNGRSAIDILGEAYEVDVYRFGAQAEPYLLKPEASAKNTASRTATAAEDAEALLREQDASAGEQSFRSATDFTRTIEKVTRDIPFEQIAGILVLTDGRHNGDAGVEAMAHRLGGAKIPINSIVIGGSRLPSDVAIAQANAPESIFLGDKLRVSGIVSATGFRGKQIGISLYLNDTLLEEKKEFVDSDDFSKEFRFTDLPEDRGVRRYRVAVSAPEGDEFPENNDFSLDVSVTDDRTNVLLVDDRPRWEFRYLRNLFYGRDKSVHLQEYLIHPDTVQGQSEEPLPAANAARKFGDSESGSWPRTRMDWSKFDVIILGDLDEEALTPAVVEALRYCVEQRGALLVFISGPNHFPHQIQNPRLLEILPVETERRMEENLASPEDSFHFRLAPAGRMHPVMQQSSSSYENDQIWSDLPEFYWRHAVKGVKPGAEVLAFAEPTGTPEAEAMARDAVRALEQGQGTEDAAQLIAKMREMQSENSLLVIRNQGRGKVLQLNTDRTWRLRYRVGDTRHHRFWGQILRWGAGEKLRTGNLYVRLGTDQLRYTPTDPVRLQARFQDAEFSAINDLKPTADILDFNGQVLRSVRLRYREDSPGFYEAEVEPFEKPGTYRVRLSCDKARRMLGSDWPDTTETQFMVVTSRRPAEFVQISSSLDVPRRMAAASGGKVVSPSHLADVLKDYGEGNRVIHERTEIYLWDHWLLLFLLLGVLSAEWILRKKSGLS